VRITDWIHAVSAACLYRSASLSTARAQVALGGPFLPSYACYNVSSTHAHRRAFHIASAHARPRPYLVRLIRLQYYVSAPARGLVGFPLSRWRTVLNCYAWLGSGCRCMAVIQCSRRIRAWRYGYRRFSRCNTDAQNLLRHLACLNRLPTSRAGFCLPRQLVVTLRDLRNIPPLPTQQCTNAHPHTPYLHRRIKNTKSLSA
jgi:hypothetical protein